MMPPLWTGACVLLWGYSIQQTWLALTVAILLEAAGPLGLRWALDTRQFERCADASSIGFAAVAIYQFNVHGLYGIYAILALMPWCLVPLALVQVYSTDRLTPLSALVYSLRSVRNGGRIDLRLALGLSALVAASAGEIPRGQYAAGMLLLTGWLLWARRPHRHRQGRWLMVTMAALVLGVALQSGFVSLHLALGELVQDWFRDMQISPADADRTSTAIGNMRQLKLSDQIYLRVRSPLPPQLPLLLTEATYTDFRFGSWSNRNAAFSAVDAQPGARVWPLGPTRQVSHEFDLSLMRKRDVGIVPLPAGATRIAGNRLLEVQRNALGALSVEAPPGLLRYQVSSEPGGIALAPPRDGDLDVPPDYRGVMTRIAEELALAKLTPRQRIDAVREHFARHFRYALVQPAAVPWRTPLTSFLTKTRRGHCEYFASATVLLLRSAGIPARYAVGYAVDEYSSLERAWLARARDAHAWTQAYVDGRWEVVDTTPSQWAALEDDGASRWQSWFDAASWLAYTVRSLQAGDAPRLRIALQGLGVLLLGTLLWRQRKRLQRAPAAPTSGGLPGAAGAALAVLVTRLARQGKRPAPGETTAHFLRRHLPAAIDGRTLEELIGLYYAERFGERLLDSGERARLAEGVNAYAQTHSAASDPQRGRKGA